MQNLFPKDIAGSDNTRSNFMLGISGYIRGSINVVPTTDFVVYSMKRAEDQVLHMICATAVTNIHASIVCSRPLSGFTSRHESVES